MESEIFRCGYCGVALEFATSGTLRHVVRHVGEYGYLAAYHRRLERSGYDELSAHRATLEAAEKLRQAHS